MTYTTGSSWTSGNRAEKPAQDLRGRDSGLDAKENHLRNLSRRAPQPVSRLDKERVEPKALSRYTISVLLDDGSVNSFDHKAPSDLYLEDVCACFARGSLIATARGQIAIEDLQPGDLVATRDNGMQALRWISSCTMPVNDSAEDNHPIRIKADALGELRPLQDLVVSPRFRLLSNHPSCAALFGSPETLAPAVDLLDNDTILRVRPAEDLYFYNLMFDQHQIIQANGLETESYHPGNFGVAVMTLEQQSHLRQIFPHLNGDLSGFGRTARPILKGFEAEVLRVG